MVVDTKHAYMPWLPHRFGPQVFQCSCRSKPEGAAAATEGEQIPFSGPAGDEEPMDTEAPAQVAKPVMNIEVDRGSIQPQGTASDQDQRLSHSEAPPAAQPQNLAATGSLGRPIIQT